MREPGLVDLIDIKVLQRIQDGFSEFTGMAALTTDEKGIPVTQGSGFTDFCFHLTRQSPLGYKRCRECDKLGALKTLDEGKPVVYSCHAGLLDYAAPIMLSGRFIGSFIGGQVRTSPVDEEQMRKTAWELSIDAEEYIAAAKQTNQIAPEDVKRAAQFLSDIADILSEMAYKSYTALQNSRKLERSARSQTAFIIDMNQKLQNDVQLWLTNAKQALKSEEKLTMEATLKNLLIRGPILLSAMTDTMEYAKMTKGKIELNEVEYNITELIHFVCDNIDEIRNDKRVLIRTLVSRNVPERLFGDEGRIGQILSKLIANSVRYTHEGEIVIQVDTEKTTYAVNLIIRISDTGRGIAPEDVSLINQVFEQQQIAILNRKMDDDIGLTMIAFLAKQMSGTIFVESEVGVGTTFTIRLPQLQFS